jgi:uncharacterized protein (TIGR02001 family)
MRKINQLPRVKKTNHHYIACAVFLIVTGLMSIMLVAQAADESKFSATATFTTDYIWHGYSKSKGNPVFQANLDYHHSSGLFGGLWFSQVDFGDERANRRAIKKGAPTLFKHISELEFIPYFGYAFSLSDDWNADIQWSRYIYNGNFFNLVNDVNKSADYNEFSTAINFRDLLTARIGVTDNGYGDGGVYPVYELIGRYPITDLFEFSTKVGFVRSKSALDYNYLYWDAGVGFYYRFLALDFRYTQSSRSYKKDRGDGFDSIKPTFVFTVSVGY